MNVIRTDRFDARAYENALVLSPDLQALEQQGLPVTDAWAAFQGDIFQEHYQYAPELTERTRLNGPFHRLVESIRDTTEHQTIRELTRNDLFNSTIATHVAGQDLIPKLGEKLAEELSRRESLVRRKKRAESAVQILQRQAKRQAQTQTQRDADNGNGDAEMLSPQEVGAETSDALARAREIGEFVKELSEIDQEIDGLDDDIDFAKEIAEVRRAYRQGADKAIQVLTYLTGAGDGLGLNTGGMPLVAKKALAAKLMHSKKLHEIFQEAGRIKKIVGNKTANVVPDRREEKVGIRVGRMPIHDILVEELALAGDKRAALLFAKKYATESLLLRRWAGKEQLGAGPIIILRDDSGSMAGSKEVWAKAITLAFLNLAARDKRDVYVMAFSHSPGQARTWVFPYRSHPGDVTWDTVLDCMEMFIDGGTDFMYPLGWAVERIENAARPGSHPVDKPWEKADIVLISDGEADITAAWKTAFAAKQKELQFHTFAVLLGADAGSLTGVIDNVHPIKNIAEDSRHEFRMSAEDEENVIAELFVHSAGAH